MVSQDQVCQAVLDGMDASMVAIDTDYRIITINRAAEKFLGVCRKQILGQSFYQAFPDAPDEVRFVERTLDTEEELRNVELPFVWGEFNHYLSVNTYLLREENGTKYGALLAFSDITQTRRNVNQILRSFQIDTISRVATGLAHELRNPLLIIRGYLEMYLQRTFLCPRRRKVYNLLLRQIDKTNSQIQKFLDIYRPLGGDMTSIDLGDVVRYVTDIMQPFACSYGVELVCRITPGLIAKGDKERLEQVLINLVKNGLESIGGKKGKIEIVLAKADSQACLIVRDNGCGIPEHNLSRIGIPFYTSKPDGTGIGLALSYAIIDQHGGHIEFESVDGSGTSVLVFLPLMTQPA